MENSTHAVTFFFNGGAEQKVFWNKAKLDPKKSIRELANDWRNDLGATSYSVETIG